MMFCPMTWLSLRRIGLFPHPPKIIVYLKLKGEVAQGHELLFRDSKLSGQREITKAIKYLTDSGKYNLEKSYIVPDGNVLEVWRLTP